MRSGGYKCYNIKCGSCVGKTLCGEPADSALGCVNRVVITQTNADRIRAMTDEELVKLLAILTKNDICMNPSAVVCDSCPFSAFCGDCIEGNELDWLQQPVKEGAE